MNKKWILLMISCMLCLTGCRYLMPGTQDSTPAYTYTSETGYDTIRWDPVTLKVEKSYLSKSDRNYTAQQVESAVEAAKQFLSGRELHDVELMLHDGSGATMVYEGRAEIYYAQNRDIPYTSLITQVMAGVDGVPDWLREGVGAWSADINKESLMDTQAHMIECLQTYAERIEAEQDPEGEPVELYFDIDTLAKVLIADHAYESAMELGDMTEGIATIGYAQEAYNFRGAYCVYAGSFVRYLDKTYGRDSLMAVYDGADFNETMGISLEEAKAAWLESLSE